MTPASSSASQPAVTGDTPADALGAAWDLLDVLPRTSAPPSMTSTTLEMAAAPQAPARESFARRARRLAQHLGLPAAAVIAALVAGIVAGRATAPDREPPASAGPPENLALLRHLDVLREAGSVGFLRDVARRNYPPPPRRFPDRWRAREQGGEAGGDPLAYPELDRAIEDLAAASLADTADRQEAERRREAFAALPGAERRRLAGAADAWSRLGGYERKELLLVARALGGRDGTGPDRDELLEAARVWHAWLALKDPAEREGAVALDRERRLEWLDHYQRGPAGGRGGAPWPNGRRGPPFGPDRGPPPPHDGPPPLSRPPPLPGETPGPPR